MTYEEFLVFVFDMPYDLKFIIDMSYDLKYVIGMWYDRNEYTNSNCPDALVPHHFSILR
jgi:hypothetical protein